KTNISDDLRNQDTAPLSVSRRVRPHADTPIFPWTAMCGRADMPPLSSGHTPGITQQLRLLLSGDWPLELELRRGTQAANHWRGGAEWQSEGQRRSSEGAAGEGRQLTGKCLYCARMVLLQPGMLAVDGRGRK
ncbi:unnamed protein product, partial [Staurois parvus]